MEKPGTAWKAIPGFEHQPLWKADAMPIVEQSAVSAVKTCAIDGCEKPRGTRGWCEMHYTRWKRYGDPLWTFPPRFCSIDGCEQPHTGHGWCQLHYDRWRRHGDPLWMPSQVCSIEGCENTPKTRGWCVTHYRRWKRHGDPLSEEPPPWPDAEVPTYDMVHARLRYKARASTLPCAHCGTQSRAWAYDHADPYELTSPDGHPYSLDPQHYLPLCTTCHGRFDRSAARMAGKDDEARAAIELALSRFTRR